MSTFYSPEGNAEVWASKPNGYYTLEEWAALHPAPKPTVEEVRESKLSELAYSFNQRVSGVVQTSQGYSMQFDTSDSLKMQGAIQLMETVGQAEGYLTQANDVTVYHVPIATMKAVLVEMLAAYAACHARKQELRAQINAAQNEEELNAIEITWPV
jgi:hypothetical protein